MIASVYVIAHLAHYFLYEYIDFADMLSLQSAAIVILH